MRLIIAGGRSYRLSAAEYCRLDKEFLPGLVEVIVGGAPGVDTCGEAWAICKRIPVHVFRPKWNEYGKAAGPRRNAIMAMNADAVVLFSGGKGTESMFQQAKNHGLKIYDWR